MATTVELTQRPSRDPSILTYADVTGGVEPDAVIDYNGLVLIHFKGATNLTDEQKVAVQARAQGTATEDQLRKDVIAQNPPIQQIINSTGTLTAAQLSDAVRALAKAVFALGKLVLNREP